MKFSLVKIEIAGFRGVREAVLLDFSKVSCGLYFVRGVNREDARLGSNGAGKSTVFAEALIWALTGRTSRAQRPGADVENRSAVGTRVRVTFALDDALHAVERTRRPNNLLLDGKKVEQGEIDAMLPVTDAALRKTLVIDQFGEMFLSLRPEAKSQLFTETLDLDRWLRAADSAGVQADQANRAVQLSERKQEGLLASLGEARDQRDRARQLEDRFEDELKGLMSAAKVKLKAARTAASERRSELEGARAKSARLSDADGTLKLNDERSALRKLHGSKAAVAARVLSADRELARLRARLDEYKDEHKGASRCPECGQVVDKAHVEERREALLAEIKKTDGVRRESQEVDGGLAKQILRAEKLVASLEQQLTESSAVLAEVAVCAERSLAADGEKHRLDDALKELGDRENPFTAQCDQLEKRIRELRAGSKALKLEIDGLAVKLSIYQFWQRGFREIRLQQIDAALAELELATNRHAEELGLEGWRIEFATERETKRGTVSHGFTVALYPPNEEEPVSWESYSGGEVQRWQLATTFGLSEVLLTRAGLTTDFEILDEPSTHLSPEGVEDLLACLADRARDLGRRIFVIDHGALDRGSFDGVVTIAKDGRRGTYVEDGGGVFSLPAKSRRERVSL